MAGEQQGDSGLPLPIEAPKPPLSEVPLATKERQPPQLEVLWRIIPPGQWTGRSIRLYRSESLPHTPLQDDAQTGRWFSISLEAVEGLGGSGPAVGVRYVDVPEEIFFSLAEQSTTPVGELLLPRGLAESAMPFTRDVLSPPGGLIPMGELLHQRFRTIGTVSTPARQTAAPLEPGAGVPVSPQAAPLAEQPPAPTERSLLTHIRSLLQRRPT